MAIPNNQYIPSLQEKKALGERLFRVMSDRGHDVHWIQKKYKISASPIKNALDGKDASVNNSVYNYLHDSTQRVLNKYFEEYDKQNNQVLFTPKIENIEITKDSKYAEIIKQSKTTNKFKVSLESDGVLIEKEVTETQFSKIVGFTFNILKE